MPTMAELFRDRAGDEHPAMLFEDESWNYAELVRAAARRASLLRAQLRPGPPHVGVLLDNVPEFPMWLGAAALARATVVGINPTRRGAELARDIRHTDCQLIVTEPSYRPLLDGLDLGIDDDRVLVVGTAEYDALLADHADAPLGGEDADPGDLYLLLFTSGTSGAPKACLCSQGRLARIGEIVTKNYGLGPNDVVYEAMPMFHSNALMAGWAPAIAGGCTVALRRRFSASGFLPDVRKFGVTFFNYVGKPLSYILATPEQPDDADNPLRSVFGNEGAERDIERFARRFGCHVTDSYGSTEGGATVQRVPGQPAGSLGKGPAGTVVLDPETGEECPPARFDDAGHLLNADEAIGELVNKLGALGFEGYWKNDDANAARVRDGWYWTGDLAYRDADGWFYFAGRDFEWLRVDGENFAAAPIERILERHPDVVLAAVYAVPAADVGDEVMAALQLRPGATFDADAFLAFLDEQDDLGTKWAPRFVRVTAELPVTQTSKILKRTLRRERWETADDVWWRPDTRGPYRPMTADDATSLHEEFERRGRTDALDAV
ncbi:MAG TPA: long-chain-fatty-acid--CoA ligase [Acidimicrobiia bacterium]|nr:long-chain-fatty-acid--CoA ligase [Acidimicrobiia bacterium]